MAGAQEELVEQLSQMSTRQIVRWLATPAKSGFFLSGADVQRVGRDLGVHVSPFGRSAGLEQLLRGAAIDGRLKESLAAIRDEMASHLAVYGSFELPSLAGWIDRGTATLEAWTAIEEAFEDETSSTD